MFEHMRDNQMYSQSEEMERSDCSASQAVHSPVLLNILPFVSKILMKMLSRWNPIQFLGDDTKKCLQSDTFTKKDPMFS